MVQAMWIFTVKMRIDAMSANLMRLIGIVLLCAHLVDPSINVTLVADRRRLLSKPEGNLLLGVLDRVGTVADVATDIDGKVTTDRARGRSERVGSSEKDTTLFDGLLAFPNHGSDGARVHVPIERKHQRGVFGISACSYDGWKRSMTYLIRPGKKGLPLRSA